MPKTNQKTSGFEKIVVVIVVIFNLSKDIKYIINNNHILKK
jgi:hypothetical protein